MRGDVLEPATLGPALEGIACAYYLVHSMGRGRDGDFAARDRRAAANFGAAAAAAGVERLIYLGGLGEPGSEHLRSRHQTAEALARSGVPLTYFRAAAVIGAGSESFRVVYYLVKRLPAMVTPRWVTHPDAADRDRRRGRLPARRAATSRRPPGARSRSAAREVTTYGGMMEEMARALDRRRRRCSIPVPLLTPRLSSLWIGLVTPVDVGVARPLIEGLATETVVTDRSGMELFDVEPTPLDDGDASAALRRDRVEP